MNEPFSELRRRKVPVAGMHEVAKETRVPEQKSVPKQNGTEREVASTGRKLKDPKLDKMMAIFMIDALSKKMV